MSEVSLAVSFSVDTEALDLLYFEQESWAPYTGVLTKAAILLFLDNLVNHAENDVEVDCGVEENGSFLKIVYSYPAYPSLAYTVKTSYGSFISHIQEDLDFEEVIAFSLSTEASLKHNPQNAPELTWMGSVYDRDGNVVPAPAISIDGKIVTITEEIYGSLQVNYSVFRRIHTLRVDPRLDAIENVGSSVVYGVYDGGIAWIVIDPPPGLDDLLGAECGWGWGGAVTDPEDDPMNSPLNSNANRIIDVDYCSQIVIRDELYSF